MSRHLKRLAVPRKWSVPRKTATWATKPSPGAHRQDEGLPLGVVLRDYLKVCDTAGEARWILGTRNVRVDGRVVQDHKFSVGLMDVVSLQAEERHVRVLQDRRGMLRLVDIPKEEAGWKFCRVENKTVVAGGKIQLNLHDGRNIAVKETTVKSGDVLKITLPKQEVAATYPMEPGATALITGGAHVGEVARIKRIETTLSSKPALVHIEGERPFQTIKPYVFVVGKERTELRLPEVSALA